MKNLRDRRRWPRKILSAPEVCFLDIDTAKRGTEYHLDEFRSSLYVDICEVSPGGVRIKSEEKIECAGLLYLNIYCSSEKLWKCCQGGIKWVQKDSPEHGAYHIGVEVRQSNSEIKAAGHGDKRFKITPLPTDYEFFKGTKFFRSVPRTALCTLLNSLGHIRLKRGERLMAREKPVTVFLSFKVGQALIDLHRLADKFRLKRSDLSLGKQKMTTLYLMYKEDQRQALGQIVKDFSESIENPGIIQQMASLQMDRHKMTTIFIIYKDFHQKELYKKIEEFSTKVKEIGVIQKASDFQYV